MREMENKVQFDDSLLATPDQAKVRELVSALPEDTLSLAWRSGLNERLLETAAKNQKKRRIAWVWRPAFGMAATAMFAVLFLVNNTPVAPIAQESTLEAAILTDHRHNLALTDVAGAGLHPLEAQPTSYSVDDTDWHDFDFDAL
jgi:hypothetical protein